ncbi:hypothetical protein PCASD_20608 [Puccinia coronata f. sp. avenae]|uniref:Uncharacterized protein n=1 Tax=Puccinia coronata f. sp. avenae TaxID=200324 RepID=A0A2N5SU01_9BASI|nr:hypothetical protein PCASD_20608 [Puccinia coronata f. sp. avenae]
MAGVANSDNPAASTSAPSALSRYTSTIEDIYPPLPFIAAPTSSQPDNPTIHQLAQPLSHVPDLGPQPSSPFRSTSCP